MKRPFTQLLKPSRLTPWVIAVAAIGLLGYRLISLTPHLARSEAALPSSHQLLSNLWNQPIDLPYTLSQLAVHAIPGVDGVGAARLPSVLLGLCLVVASYWLLQRWYGYRLALFGSLLLITAPWFLHRARFASPEIMYPLATMLLLVLAALWHQKQARRWLLYATAIIGALMLYVPGMIWLLIGLKLMERKNIISQFKTYKLHGGVAVALSVLTIVPLMHGLVVDGQLYRQVFGLPAVLPSLTEFGQHYVLIWKYIFVGGLYQPAYTLGGLPIVDFLTSLSFVVGVYLYSRHPKALRTRQLLFVWIVGTALAALQGPARLGIIMPVIVVLSIGGVGYLLHLWLKVFPRNPIARTFGISVMGVVILFAVAYNLRNYYIAWPHTAATRSAFQQQP